jgi:predicted N-formylglutamate amidohydrolase
MPRASARPGAPDRASFSLVVTCEHASNHIPAAYRARVTAGLRILESHRGWDPGALDLARRVARRYRAPLAATRVSRLLVECNRSLSHPQLFSEFARGFDDEERDTIVARYYLPHRDRVETLVREHTARRQCVLHVGVHTFTPVLGGVARRADVGLLYDPRRPAEAALVRAWRGAVVALDASLRVRLNYPYRGWTDGLTTSLRMQFPDARYAGVELEVNQRIVRGDPARWRRVQSVLVESLAAVASLR